MSEASSTVATEQEVMARVRAAEAKVQQLQEELDQTKGKLALSEQKVATSAARIRELGDLNEWFQAAYRARVSPPPRWCGAAMPVHDPVSDAW